MQALVTQVDAWPPRAGPRSGLDSARVAMILAVLDKRADAPIGGSDAYLSTVGGVRLTEPAADLAITLALAGAITDRPAAARHHRLRRGRPGRRDPPGHRRPPPARRGARGSASPGRSCRPGVVGGGPVPDGIRVVEAATVAEAVTRGLLQAG